MRQSIWQLQFTFPRPGRRGESPRKRAGRDHDFTRRAFDLCIAVGVPSLAPRVQVVWNRRMRSTAGRAMWPEAVVEMNPALEDISAEEVERTFLHELAHLVAYERAGNRRIMPHGPEWQRACCDLGIPGERASHQLPLPTRTLRRKWAYVCPNCWSQTERVRRMRGHVACYECCIKFAGGEYDQRFRFIEKRIGA
ncbi:MAG: SprT-like domain-containing protein [Akkermansiaceae bacterium]|nr:SprT-like domain-containing protein [Akkermansiaceae bacterium]NNM31135.1 SprT-like domain-containing protein [Akkermansiaceae bacterium]